jgi:hypothetical protein
MTKVFVSHLGVDSDPAGHSTDVRRAARRAVWLGDRRGEVGSSVAETIHAKVAIEHRTVAR